jgi:hypothetical protein
MLDDQKKKLIRYILVAALMLVVVLMVADFNARMIALNRLTVEKDVVSTQYSSHMETQAALTAQIVYATSDEAVYRWAYENHLLRPGDIPVIVIGSGKTTPTPLPIIVATPTVVSNFRIWVDLFLKPPAP